MSKSFKSDTKFVGNILGNYERRIVFVPRFQRGYSWEKTHVGAFWNDVIAFKKEYAKAPTSATYFFGPIVIEDKDEQIVLLDGQQRLATVTILLSVIRNTARTLGPQSGHDFARDIQRNLIEKVDVTGEVALHLGELDLEFFRKTIQDDPPATVAPRLRSHIRISEAAKMLKAEVGIRIAGASSDDALVELKAIQDCVVKAMTLVAITVEDENDAFSIFETLNDRGLRLSVPDLLLNLLMRRAGNDATRKRVREKWNFMLEQMGKKDISRFLRHMWLARYGDLKARGLFAELKDHLTAGTIPSLTFVEDCSTDCDAYIALIEKTNELPAEAVSSVVGLIKYMGATSSLPLLLSALQCLKQQDFISLSRYAASLVLRYSVISNLNPNTLESAFYEAARDIRGKKSVGESSPKMLKAAKLILAKLNPDDNTVKGNAVNVLFDRGPALWMMTQLTNSKQSTTNEIAINQANLEHIFPQHAKATEWPNLKDLKDYLWSLGNLTILGNKLNASAANKGFADKRNNHYKKSEIVITKEILAYTTWTPADVEARAKSLAELILSVFPA